MMARDKKLSQPVMIGYFREEDLNFVLKFYLKKIRALHKSSQSNSIKNLMACSKEAHCLQRYIEDMAFFGWPAITKHFQNAFKKERGSANVLKEIQKSAFEKAIGRMEGRQRLGENVYIIHERKIYLRSLKGKWFIIQPRHVFLLLPPLVQPVKNKQLIALLEKQFQPTPLDELFQLWMRKPWSKKVNPSLLYLRKGITTPDEYFKHVEKQIQNINKYPVSLSALQTFCDQGDEYFEKLIKVSYYLIQFVHHLRQKNACLIHILRDGMMFAETQYTLDILTKKPTAQSQLMIGRKLLSKQGKKEYYWQIMVDSLYAAQRRYPRRFSLFYKEYTKNLRNKEQKDHELKALIKHLAQYIQEHMGKNIQQRGKFIIVDTGLQGSVNMLIKYIIDQHIAPKTKKGVASDIYMFVVGAWLKNIYKGKFFSHYYPMMKDIEVFMRSDQLYHYVPGSFEKGKLQVKMGTHKKQILANIELIVLVQTCMLAYQKNLFKFN